MDRQVDGTMEGLTERRMDRDGDALPYLKSEFSVPKTSKQDRIHKQQTRLPLGKGCLPFPGLSTCFDHCKPHILTSDVQIRENYALDSDAGRFARPDSG